MKPDAKNKYLSRRRLSRKKGWAKRRQLLSQAAKEESHKGDSDSMNFRESEISDVTPGKIELECCTQEGLDVTPKDKGMYENVLHCDPNNEAMYENVHCEDDNTLVIENSSLDKNRIQDHLVEDRIMHVDFFLKEMRRTFFNHPPNIECQYQDWTFINSKRHGLLTQFFFECQTCKYEDNFWSHPTDNKTLDINTADTAVIISVEKNKGMYQNIDNCEDNDTLVIDNTGLDTGIQDSKVEGRRIVDFSFVLDEMHRTFDNHMKGIECQFRNWKLISSHQCGLLTQLFFKCEMCNYEDNFWSESRESEIMDINSAAVAASITTGIGYAQLEEQCATMNIPSMSEPTYIKYRENLVHDFQKTAVENMKMAAEVEKQLAFDRNDTINGIPYITVVADGSWMKRSYGNAYNSLSGVGAILGFHTKKILFVGIRNKYCAVCDMAERKGVEPKAHECYKNFDRNASSTRMESDAIVEGFKCSLEMHGLIYNTVIADGDSSVYQSILDNNPYSEQMVKVEKIECTNHLLRNLCRKLRAAAEMTQPKTQKQPGFAQARNVVKSNVLNIRREVEKLAELRRREQKPEHLKALELQKDILNIPSHVFGDHERCQESERICEENDNETQKNHVPQLQSHGLFQKIESALEYLSSYSDSLILNYTNNPAESFNSIICKEIGGKRINFGKRGSYNARVAGAVVQGV